MFDVAAFYKRNVRFVLDLLLLRDTENHQFDPDFSGVHVVVKIKFCQTIIFLKTCKCNLKTIAKHQFSILQGWG